ncbi:DUF5722 domain-containing protein [Alistipes putredinis]|uniref:DUF5722 domain-containing protein n=1 Tax=Alistipes putredinis TaxID=28117 RepID=UPI0039948EE6
MALRSGNQLPTYAEADLRNQCAGFAYGWKKIAALPGIDGIQWHNWFDHRNEGTLRIGLRRYPDDAEDPGGKKPIWETYRDAGTDREERPSRLSSPSSASPTGTFCNPSQTETDEKRHRGVRDCSERPDAVSRPQNGLPLRCRRQCNRIFPSAGSLATNSLLKPVGVTSTTLMPVEAP